MTRHYYLTPVLGGPGAPRYPIAEDPLLIGRSERAAIALLEPTVSREHAAIQCREGTVYLEDLGSKHGTFVNSKRISATKLRVGDIIVFGLSLVLRLEESEHPLPPSPGPSPSGTSNTVSAVQPMPPGALSSAGGETQRVQRVDFEAARDRTEEVERLSDQLARVYKLAAAGATLLPALDDLYRRLASVTESIRRQPMPPDELLAELDPMLADLDHLRRATQPRTPRLEPLGLFDIVRKAVSEVKPLADQRSVDLLVAVPVQLTVLADKARLCAALTELLRNAAAVSPTGRPVEIGAEEAGEDVFVTITDGGPGLTEEQADRAFEPFITLREDRTAVGLGLYEARYLIHTLGGSISLQPEEGGTTAVVQLRRA